MSKEIEAFQRPYEFDEFNKLGNEQEAERMVEALTPFYMKEGFKQDEFLASLMLACATFVTACCADESTACTVSNRLANYLHDASHSMYAGEGPAPNVTHVGTA